MRPASVWETALRHTGHVPRLDAGVRTPAQTAKPCLSGRGNCGVSSTCMCYAIPGRVVAVSDSIVTVDYFGERRTARADLLPAEVGDYVYAQGGYVIQKLPAQEAEEILATWRETFFELQETDVRLSRIALKSARNRNPQVVRLLDRALERTPLSPDDLKSLLALNDPSEMDLLFKTANFLRRKHLGNSCCVHGIIEISNICRRACAYCGISTHNRGLRRYRMTRREILEAVQEAVIGHGFKALVLQSGENDESVDDVAAVIREARKTLPALFFISLGEIGKEGLAALYREGARGLLLRFETSNAGLYEALHPGCALESRRAEIARAREMGYLILTGGLIGLPGQDISDIVSDILLARDLGAEMFSFGPFLPHPETPLKTASPPDESLVLKVLAVSRLVDVNAKVLVTTGLETLSPAARRAGLLAGANSVMLNATPMRFRRLYTIYPNRAHEDEDLSRQIEETISLLRSLGRAPTDLGI